MSIDIVIVRDKRVFMYRWMTGLATIVDGIITFLSFGCIHTNFSFKMVCKDAKYRCRNNIKLKVISIGKK
jgi:hypothetical protein